MAIIKVLNIVVRSQSTLIDIQVILLITCPESFQDKKGDKMYRSLLIASILMLLASCGQKAQKQLTAKAINDDLQKLDPESQNSSPLLSFRPKFEKPTFKNPKTFAKNFCNFISTNPNPFKIEQFVNSEQTLQSLMGQLEYLGRNKLACDYSKEIFDHFPLHLVEYQIKSGAFIYINFLYDRKNKISQASVVATRSKIVIEPTNIISRDGKNLNTFIFRKDDNKKRGTILLRTPYFHTSPYYISMANSFMQGDYNVAIQSNRGSYLSEGEFRWLDKENAADAFDTIEAIAQMSFSNGKVVSYGVSYDGFNALASGIENPPALKGIIACSAPANAATDSFTSNAVAEAFLLNYIWQRESGEGASNFYTKYMYVKSINTPLEDYDNIIFGRDVADWEDFLNNPKQYWKNRNLLPSLNGIDIPTIHVAGLTNDQDSRDTILAYESIQKNSPNADIHRLLMHKGGHGCGSFQSSLEFKNYFSLASDSPKSIEAPQVRQHSQSLENYISGDHYPLKQFPVLVQKLPNSVEGREQQVSQNTPTELKVGLLLDSTQQMRAGLQSTTFVFEIEKDMIVNGLPKLQLKATSQAPETVIHVTTSILRPDGSTKNFNRTQRSAVVWNDDVKLKGIATITMPPTLTKISAGSKVLLKLSTQGSVHIAPISKKRADFFKNEPYGTVAIFSESALMLPTEPEVPALP